MQPQIDLQKPWLEKLVMKSKVLDGEILWQREPNCVWFSNLKSTCSFCNKKTHIAVEVVVEDQTFRFCFGTKRKCFILGIERLFVSHKNFEFYWTRQIIYEKPLKNKKREPIGLSKRYKVFKRDGFQCVFCGNSGKDARLEIDHKVPVAEGGSDRIGNLQTLCFECNRGKRDSC